MDAEEDREFYGVRRGKRRSWANKTEGVGGVVGVADVTFPIVFRLSRLNYQLFIFGAPQSGFSLPPSSLLRLDRWATAAPPGVRSCSYPRPSIHRSFILIFGFGCDWAAGAGALGSGSLLLWIPAGSPVPFSRDFLVSHQRSLSTGGRVGELLRDS